MNHVYDKLAEMKAQGNRIIGYFCRSFPKEIIYAAGILPVRILGTTEPVGEADDFWTSYACYLSRSSVELALQGKLNCLDGTVMAFSCDTLKFLSERWKQIAQFPEDHFTHFLVQPQNLFDGSEDVYLNELIHFKDSLEKHFQVKITDQALAGAISLYNENRKLLQKVDNLRRKGLVTGVEAASLAFSGMVSPPDESNAVLTEFLSKVNERPSEKDGQVRLFVAGSWLPDEELFEVIEELGATVGADDLCVGYRYYWGYIDESAPNPLRAIARYYLAVEAPQCQCACMSTENRVEARLQNIIDTVKELNLKGVVFAIPRYCDLHLWDHKKMKKKLEENGIRSMLINVEQSLKNQQVRNRLQAFIEMVG